MNIYFPQEAWDKLDEKTKKSIQNALMTTQCPYIPDRAAIMTMSYYGSPAGYFHIQPTGNEYFTELNKFNPVIVELLEVKRLRKVSVELDLLKNSLRTLKNTLSLVESNEK